MSSAITTKGSASTGDPSVGLWVLLVFTAALYAQNISHDFVFDDIRKIAHNEQIRSPSLFMRSLFSSEYNEIKGRLIPNLTFLLTYQLFGPYPSAYNLTNLIIHLCNTWLVYVLARKLAILFRSHYALLPLCAAIVFALHPLNTEAVNYSNARPNTLCTTFYVLTVSSMLTLIGNRTGTQATAWLTVLFGACALWCKEMAISLILMIPFVLWIMPQSLNGRVLWRHKYALPSVIALGVGCIIAVVSGAFLGAVQSLTPSKSAWEGLSSIAASLITQGNVVVRYAGLMLLPLPEHLCVSHDVTHLADRIPWAHAAGMGRVAGALVVESLGLGAVVMISVGLWRRRRAYGLAGFGLGWCIITLLPNALIPRGEQMVEYRTYLPMVGGSVLIALAAAHGQEWLKSRLSQVMGETRVTTILAVVGASIASCYVASSMVRNAVWRSEEVLWEDVVRKYPNSYRGNYNYGTVLGSKNRLREAVRYLERAATKCPHEPAAHYNLGRALYGLKNVSDAKVHFSRALVLDASDPRPAQALAEIAVHYEEWDVAIHNLEVARRRRPGDSLALVTLARIHELRGSIQEAIKCYEEVLSDPSRKEMALRALVELRRRAAESR